MFADRSVSPGMCLLARYESTSCRDDFYLALAHNRVKIDDNPFDRLKERQPFLVGGVHVDDLDCINCIAGWLPVQVPFVTHVYSYCIGFCPVSGC